MNHKIIEITEKTGWEALFFAEGYGYPFVSELMPMWNVAIFIFGLCIGSFLNVCICRIPNDESIITPPSHCPKCGHEIRWYENIPLLSWIFLGGKCSSCKLEIPFRYFFVELLTGVMFYLVWARIIIYHLPLTLLIPVLAVTMLIITTVFIDFEHRIIPNETTYPVIIIGIISSIFFPENFGKDIWYEGLYMSGLGFALGVLSFAFLVLMGKLIFKQEALGWGDVKFMGAVGACLGAGGVIMGTFLGTFAAAFISIILIIGGKKKLKSTLAFGPYLAGGVYIWILYGRKILNLYIEYFQNR